MSTLFIVLAGGLEENGDIPEYVLRRIHVLPDMYKAGDSVVFSSCFSLNVPPRLDERGYVKSEASAMFCYSKSLGIPESAMFCEQFSHDTIGSIFLLFMLFIPFIRSENIMIITSDFHGNRVRQIVEKFASIFSILTPIEVKTTSSTRDFEAREEKELRSSKDFREEWKDIISVEQGLKKLFLDHSNYNWRYRSVRDMNLIDESYGTVR